LFQERGTKKKREVINMFNEKVCVGYVNNSVDRRITVARWQEIFEAMPIGVPLTATEIAERANEHRTSYHIYSHHNIPPMAKALGLGVIKREKIAIEPYEVEIEYFDHWECGVYPPKRVMGKKKIVVSEKTVYTRLV
jgi:hypothetical protein